MRIRRPKRSERGLTLMELMLTLAIVAVGILGLTSMNFQSARAVQDAAEISLATNLATAALDEIQVGSYIDLSVGAVDDFPIFFDKFGRSLPSVDDSYFTVDALVESESPSLGYKDLLVTVSWLDTEVGGASTWGSDREVQIRGRVRQLARGN
ncbi:MAG: prepilin-type N-terminal cleavage/methylation domain-containing protein [Myxococcota bacterium]